MLSTIRAARTLRRQRMPFEEIRAVLTANDPAVVHHYLELHAERLDEWVAEERRRLASIEGAITEERVGMGGRQRRSEGPLVQA
jgi:DNA-binding transcriptional MerR regulator